MQNKTKHVHATMSFNPIDLVDIDERAERLGMTRSEYMCRCAKCVADIADDVFVQGLRYHESREERDLAITDNVRDELTHYFGLSDLEAYYHYRDYEWLNCKDAVAE